MSHTSSLDLLSPLPAGLRQPLLNCFNEVRANFLESRWEPSELNGGKFCEVAYTIIKGALDGQYPSAPSKPRNLAEACRAIEQTPTTTMRGDRSLRVLIPRILVALYEIRN